LHKLEKSFWGYQTFRSRYQSSESEVTK